VEWALSNLAFIQGLTLTHLSISLLPLLIGTALAIGVALVTSNRVSEILSGFLNGVYAIPSLALFVALPALIGTSYIGPVNVLIALTIYVLATMFSSVRDALTQVPAAVLVIANAQGLSSLQTLFQVKLPLALPGIIAGLRVAAASTISMASIGAVVGVKNLGFLFLDGFQRKIPEEIITGVFAIFLIAIILDLGLWLLGAALTPWQRKKVRRA
jgi:osmoprotectant transport system permease protein